MNAKNHHWMTDVSPVFDTRPRNGNREDTVWLERPELESLLESELFTSGRHICIDGCSGSGKSSLAITVLLRNRIKFTTVQVTRKMDWVGFCKQVIAKPRRAERELSATGSIEAKGGIFPTGKLEISAGRKSDDKTTHEYWERLLATATEHDVAKAMAEQNCLLLVDEFERAQPELANSICEVCKILTQTYCAEFGKVIVLGADDAYKKLYDAYSTLDNRLVQISIPTLPTPRQSWTYLARGFNKLRKFYPGNSKYSTQKDERDAIEYIYLAADGLFKALTEVGVEICRHVGPTTRGIRLEHIKRVCNSMQERNYTKYRYMFSAIHQLGEANPAVVAVLLHMNKVGLGQIHSREDVEDALSSFGRGALEDAVLSLWKENFLVITGDSNQKIFIKNPSWAHTLRVYLSDAKKRKRLEQFLTKPFQFTLDLGFDWNSLDTDEEASRLDDEKDEGS